MKILIISFGKKHDPSLASLIDDFTMRTSRWVPLEWKIIPASKDEGERGRVEESDAVLRIIKETDTCIMLDERGRRMNTDIFSQYLSRMMSAGEQRLVFVIGGSHGLHPQALDRADLVLSLSDMTLPHHIVRLMLVEQIYRGLSIIAGSRYHHA